MKVLTELEEKSLKILFDIETIRRFFYLTGGTALSAFYLHHRYSDDLDLFTHEIEIDSIRREVEEAFHKTKIPLKSERASPTFHRYTIDQTLQLDLVHDTGLRVGSPQLIDGIMVDSKKNIAVNKVVAIYSRLEPKDYVDLYFLLKEGEYDMTEFFSLGQQKDGGLEPFQWAKIIDDVDTFSVLPRMIMPCNLSELKNLFHHLRDEVIDSCKPTR